MRTRAESLLSGTTTHGSVELHNGRFVSYLDGRLGVHRGVKPRKGTTWITSDEFPDPTRIRIDVIDPISSRAMMKALMGKEPHPATIRVLRWWYELQTTGYARVPDHHSSAMEPEDRPVRSSKMGKSGSVAPNSYRHISSSLKNGRLHKASGRSEFYWTK